MTKHKQLLKEKFDHAIEDLLYETGSNEIWSLFRTKNGGVAIYYHSTDNFKIIGSSKARLYSLEEIAEKFDVSSFVLS